MAEYHLDFLNADSKNTIFYLPFGVTTIEMSPKGEMPKGHVRPQNHRPPNHGTANDDKLSVGFADNTEDMLVVWGAGEEKGQFVEENTVGRFFFQLIHLKNDHESEPITLTHDAVRWKQQVLLSSACDQKEVVRMVLGEAENHLRRITFEGKKVPSYYPRWFPPRPNGGKGIEYKEVAYPAFSAEFVENDKSVYSPISLYLHEDGKKKNICNIQGDLTYAWPHIELFTLLPDEGVFVIRVWLYWIHKRFRGNKFYGFEFSDISEGTEYRRIEQRPLDISEGRRYRKIQQRLVLEIPDIERFDFVFDSRLGRITWFGTDFHYQEHWGIVKGDVADARIAGGFDLVEEVLKRIGERRKKSERYDLVDKLKRRQHRNYEVGPGEFTSIPDMNYEQVESRTYSRRAFINIRAHVPYVRNGSVDDDMVSNVVSGTMQ